MGYWEQAYAGQKYGETFDWYAQWSEKTEVGGPTLAEIVRNLLPKESKILMLGCGNSDMSALMYEDGYKMITNIDVAESVIKEMSERYAKLDKMTWLAMDASV